MFRNIKDAVSLLVILILCWYAWRLTHWVSNLEATLANDVRVISAEVGAGVQALEDRVEKRVEKIETRLAPIERWFTGWFK